ncbi:hypothetical protein LSAT2_018469 [Lamellibrachia satsuma]|nr:hypothetical protein LSAT2_018469 [Lamellibrachia satsuma]
MAPVVLQHVVSFSSQDKKHCAENLLKGSLFGKWLSASEDRSGQLDGEFQLERACQISGIDVGTQWAFSVSISVGRSSWPRGKEYVTLVPSATFMTPQDCRQGKGRDTVRMFKQGDFLAEAKNEAWDRLKITCCQPFRKDVQFGISMLQIWSTDPPETDHGLPVKNMPHLKTSPNTGSTNAAVSEIQNRLLGSTPSSQRKMTGLQARLEKIDASTENGPAQGHDMSRNARLVLAAAAKVPRYSLPPGTPEMLSGSTPRKKLDFEASVREFLTSLDIKDLDPEHMTFAGKCNLRHKFEKIKLRKLSQDEKKIFFALARNIIEDIFDVGRGTNKLSLLPDGSTCQKERKLHTTGMKQCVKSRTDSKPPAFHSRSVKAEFAKGQKGKSSCQISTAGDDVKITGFTPSFPNWASPNSRKRQRLQDTSVNKHTAAVNQIDLASSVPRTSGPRRVSPPRIKSRSRQSVAMGTWGSRGDGHVLGRGGDDGRRRNGKNARNVAPEVESSSCPQITRHRNPPREKFMSCPLCAGSFIETLIEAHAAQCQMHQRTPATALQNRQHEHSQLTSSGESCNYDDTVATSGGVYMNNAEESDCPICGISFPLELLPVHADSCADFIL